MGEIDGDDDFIAVSGLRFYSLYIKRDPTKRHYRKYFVIKIRKRAPDEWCLARCIQIYEDCIDEFKEYARSA